MPSHVAHLLFAEELIDRLGSSPLATAAGETDFRSHLALGAQGPDIFYHNQRRRPTGLPYGSLMHRHGYGTAVAHMWACAADQGLGLDSWAGAWVLGFASHAILDRATHPYINAHAGWPESGDPDSQQYRSMHPFLERLIDVELLRLRRGAHPNSLDFYRIVNCGEEPAPSLVRLVAQGLSGAYAKAAADRHLGERITAAYLDTMGYYRFTNNVSERFLEDGLSRAETTTAGARWLSIVHPLEVPGELDVLNLEHREWCHPCTSHERHRESFLDCYEEALETGTSMARAIADAWSTGRTVGLARIAEAVQDWNLSDGRPTERPCPKRHASPLPLAALQDRMRESIRAGNGGRLSANPD